MNCLCKSLLPSAGGGRLLSSFASAPFTSQRSNCIPSCRFPVKKWQPERASSDPRHLSCIAASQVEEHAKQDVRPWVSEVGESVKDKPQKRYLQVVLFQPQIAGNTGSIARTCAAASVGLHLIEPLGFKIDDAKLKRAGLDYWPFVFVKVHSSWSEFMDYFKAQEGEKRIIAFTKRATCLYTEKGYKPGDWLVFGAETTGLSAEALEDCADESNFGGGKVRIPMLDMYVRSLNLAVSVGIGVYEALRQVNVLPELGKYSEEQAELDEACNGNENVHDVEREHVPEAAEV